MSETSIEWTATRLPDGTTLPGYTFNPIWGCTKISPACTNCYAATWANRYGVGWGPKAERRTFGEKHWNEPRKWDAKARKAGHRRKVFCASMADVFEDHPAWEAERPKLWTLISETPNLDWLLLTKRPENILQFVPSPWNWQVPTNVWVGTTVETQEYANTRIPELLCVPARVRFLSCEPLLGAVDLTRIETTCTYSGEPFTFNALSNRLDGGYYVEDSPDYGESGDTDPEARALHWVITGGESGAGARPTQPDWVRSLRDQCQAAGVDYFHKQWGEHAPCEWQGLGLCLLCGQEHGRMIPGQPDSEPMIRMGKKAAGRILDGRTWDQMPSPGPRGRGGWVAG